jgi:putative ABC transport system permease protein
MLQYLRYALRALRRTPTFTATAVLTLGVSIGMASAMFTVFHAVVVRRLPVQDQDRIVELSGVAEGAAREVPLPLDPFLRFRHDSRTLQIVGGFAHWGSVSAPVTDGDRPLFLRQATVTGNFFQVLGVAPSLGRLLRPEDEREYAPNAANANALVAVISYDAWRRMFGGDAAVIGRRLHLPDMKWNATIIGVAPPGLDYPRGAELWTPNVYPGGMDVVARLGPGATLDAARADYLAFVRRDPDYVKAGLADQIGARAEPLERMVLGDVKPALIALTAAVGVLLLLACVNIGNLLLLHAAGRAPELAVRRALGAGSADIVKQLSAESAVLGIGGGVLGLGLAQELLTLLLRLAPAGLPRLDMIRIAPTPLAIAVAATVLAMLLFGSLPAVAAVRFDLSSQLRADARSGTGGRRLRGVRRALVASQIALALVLLSGAGLLMRSFARLSGLDMGFPTSHLSVLGVSMPWDKWVASCGGAPAQADSVAPKRFEKCADRWMFRFHDQLLSGLRAIPGVEKASPVAVPPFLGSNVFMTRLMAVGQSEGESSTNPWVGQDFVGPEYFDAMGLPILRGRGFTDADREGSPNVAVMTQSIATRLWPGEDPIGKQVRQAAGSPTITVVGLVGDIHFREHRHATPMIIRPFRQGLAQGSLVIRTRGELAAALPAIRRAVQAVDPDAALVDARTMDDVIAPQLAQPRLNALLLSAFAFAAVLLAAIGLYGVMASAVSHQTRELGVRLALGATPDRLRAMILGQALAVAGAGALVGLLGALAGSRLLTTMLFEVSPTDPVALLGACGLLLAVALLAAYMPARRATKVDPMVALRYE